MDGRSAVLFLRWTVSPGLYAVGASGPRPVIEPTRDHGEGVQAGDGPGALGCVTAVTGTPLVTKDG
jgi:hypothetical protein